MASIFMVVEIITKGEQEAMIDDGCSGGERPNMKILWEVMRTRCEKFNSNGMHDGGRMCGTFPLHVFGIDPTTSWS